MACPGPQAPTSTITSQFHMMLKALSMRHSDEADAGSQFEEACTCCSLQVLQARTLARTVWSSQHAHASCPLQSEIGNSNQYRIYQQLQVHMRLSVNQSSYTAIEIAMLIKPTGSVQTSMSRLDRTKSVEAHTLSSGPIFEAQAACIAGDECS